MNPTGTDHKRGAAVSLPWSYPAVSVIPGKVAGASWSILIRGGGETKLSLDWDLADEESFAGLASLTPVQVFEKEWARALLDRVMQRLATEYHEMGRGSLFEQLQAHLWGDSDSIPYAQLSGDFGMSVVNLRVFAHRMRQRFRHILREEVAQTVDRPEAIEEETQYLSRIFSA